VGGGGVVWGGGPGEWNVRGAAWQAQVAPLAFCPRCSLLLHRTLLPSSSLNAPTPVLPHLFPPGPPPRCPGAGLPARVLWRLHLAVAPRLALAPLRPLRAPLHRRGQRPEDAGPAHFPGGDLALKIGGERRGEEKRQGGEGGQGRGGGYVWGVQRELSFPLFISAFQVVRPLKDGDFVRVKMFQMETCQPKVRAGRHHDHPGGPPLTISASSTLTPQLLTPLFSLSGAFTLKPPTSHLDISRLCFSLPAGADPQDGPQVLADLGALAGPGDLQVEQDQHLRAP
jgi:hypothetical protein